MNGLYLSPGFRLAYVRADVGGTTVEGTAWSLRATVGWSFLIADGLKVR